MPPLLTATVKEVVPGSLAPVENINAIRLMSTEDAITAHAGGGKASARALTCRFNNITVVATAADSVLLPPGLVGLEITIVNSGANSMQVFGAGTDTINGVATGTGVAQAAGATVVYRCNKLTGAAYNWIATASGNGIIAGQQFVLAAITANGAINEHANGQYIITKATAAAMTLAAPTSGTDDGIIIDIASNNNAQHTVTFTGGTLKSGAAGATTATWPAQQGGAIRVMAYQAKWILLSNVGVVIT